MAKSFGIEVDGKTYAVNSTERDYKGGKGYFLNGQIQHPKTGETLYVSAHCAPSNKD